MYRVVWEMDVEDVDSPQDAAIQAWEAMRREDSIANVFTVTGPRGERYEVDLHLNTWQLQPQTNRRVRYPGDWIPLTPEVPASFPVRVLGEGEPADDPVECVTCGRSWDDAIATAYTPAPSGRCPFEAWHWCARPRAT